MGSASSWFDILIVMCGVYIIYSMIRMKTTGKIDASVLLGKNVNENMIRDKKGFVGYMFPKAVALGIITIICGIADYVNDIMGASNVINFVIMIIFLALLTVYCLCAKKAKKLFVD
jgi:hypothetical protein